MRINPQYTPTFVLNYRLLHIRFSKIGQMGSNYSTLFKKCGHVKGGAHLSCPQCWKASFDPPAMPTAQ